MKSLVVAITLVLSSQLVIAATKAASDVSVSDKTRVKCSFVIGSIRTIAAPPCRLLDDNSLLPTLRAKEKSTTLCADEMMQQTGIRFQENLGQIVDTRGKLRPEIAFVANAPGARLYFRNDGISYVFTKTMHTQTIDLPLEGIETNKGLMEESLSPWGEIQRGENQTYRLDMNLVGSNHFARIRAEGELPGYVNYYLAHCSDGITRVKEYSRIVYENVYDNVDLELFSSSGKMKYNFVVRPGGRVSDIQMQYDGASETALMNDGALSVATPLGRIEEATPFTYSGEESNEVPSRFLRKGNTVSFAVDEYDQTQTLVIDPWATYYGGSGTDATYGICVDGNGNVIIAGETTSTNFPVAGGYQNSNAGAKDAFVVKFDANGTRLWATYYGGSADDNSARVGVDASGNIIIAGWTGSSNFPVTAGAFQTTYNGDGDCFCAKFNSSGVRLWSTYFGGSKGDDFGNVALDANGNVLFSGRTSSTNFPTTPGAFQPSKSKGRTSDAFAVKLSSTGSRLWATYYGGKDGAEYAWGITADGNSNVFLSGYAPTGFPVTSGAFQTTFGGGTRDGFLVKFTSGGNRLWATYYGGNGDDQSRDIATDAAGNVVMCGYTQSTNFPASAGAFQTTYGGGFYDAFIVKFNGSGGRIWGTYYGGSGDDTALEPDVDGNGDVVIGGYTTSTNFPVTPGALQSTHAGLDDGFIIKLNSTGARLWATYYGGTGYDHIFCVDTDVNGKVLSGGNTSSVNFPTFNPYQSTNAGAHDAVIVELNSNGLFAKRTVNEHSSVTSVVLEQNYPNPFNPTTTITYEIPEDGFVHLRVFDLHGRVVSELVNGEKQAGTYTVEFDGSYLPSGVYIYRLEAGGQIRTSTMTLVK